MYTNVLTMFDQGQNVVPKISEEWSELASLWRFSLKLSLPRTNAHTNIYFLC